MVESITFKVLPAEQGWRVTKDDKTIAHYPSQHIAERAMARQARAEANKGNKARGIIYKKDGTIAAERWYSRRSTPWLGH